MRRRRTFPHRALALARTAEVEPGTPALLNGMRVTFSERVPLYPVGLHRTDTPAPESDVEERDGRR